MPRTETCGACNGAGESNDLLLGDGPCGECGGNGYVFAAETEEQLSFIGMPDIDLTNDTAPPGRMANQTWRILEEQRQAAEDTIRECDAEIERWTNKMVDAMKTKGMCEAGQRALDGGL